MTWQQITALVAIGLAMLAIAFFWNAGLLRRAQQTPARRLQGTALTLLGMLLVTLSVVAVLVVVLEADPVGVIVSLIMLLLLCAAVALSIWIQLIVSTRQSLAWYLATAADKGVPLQDAAIAFSEENNNFRRAEHLAVMLNSGAPLHDAVRFADLRLPIDARLAVEAGSRLEMVGTCMHRLMSDHEEVDGTIREAIEKAWLLAAIPAFTFCVVTFLQLKIIPVFAKMFEEFGIDTPGGFSDLLLKGELSIWMVPFGLVGLFAAMVLSFLGALYYVGLMPINFPAIHFFARGLDRARLLCVMGAALQHGRSLQETLRVLTLYYPRATMRARLRRAGMAVSQGANWIAALQKENLVTASDAAVLSSAQRTDNLGWAMNELASASAKRFAYRLRFWYSIFFPIFVFANAIIVCFVVTTVMAPLANMIQQLS